MFRAALDEADKMCILTWTIVERISTALDVARETMLRDFHAYSNYSSIYEHSVAHYDVPKMLSPHIISQT